MWDPRTGAHGPAGGSRSCATAQNTGGSRSCATAQNTGGSSFCSTAQNTGGSSFCSTADIALDLPPFGAVLLTTPKPLAQARRGLDEKKFQPTMMPLGAPVAKVGEPSRARDVKAEFKVNPDNSAWAQARILKGGVDTFMFLPYVYASSPYVAGMRGVTFETDVKADQAYAPELLVFASMEDGSMYLAHCGRTLADKGRERSYVPFSSFARHGNAGKTATFDPAKVRQFRIGFGGYFGEEGQTISYEVTPPTGYR